MSGESTWALLCEQVSTPHIHGARRAQCYRLCYKQTCCSMLPGLVSHFPHLWCLRLKSCVISMNEIWLRGKVLKNNSPRALLALLLVYSFFLCLRETKKWCFFICQIFILHSIVRYDRKENPWGLFHVLPCKPPSCLANLLCYKENWNINTLKLACLFNFSSEAFIMFPSK